MVIVFCCSCCFCTVVILCFFVFCHCFYIVSIVTLAFVAYNNSFCCYFLTFFYLVSCFSINLVLFVCSCCFIVCFRAPSRNPDEGPRVGETLATWIKIYPLHARFMFDEYVRVLGILTAKQFAVLLNVANAKF